MNKPISKILLALVVTGSSLVLNGQQAAPNMFPSIPTTPQAEAFHRYGEYAVNHFTGVPDISIPLDEINLRGYKIPVALKYYPQPIKPCYNYDVFGHGWGFSVNSCISRTIEYLPDESVGFKIERGNTIVTGTQTIFQTKYSQTTRNYLTNPNYAHDKFTATLPDGSSFDFVMEMSGNGTIAYTVSDGRKVKISCNYSTSNITSFTVIDESGVTYVFSTAETANLQNGGIHRSYNVSWMLTSIRLPNSTDVITFSYGKNIGGPNANSLYNTVLHFENEFKGVYNGTSTEFRQFARCQEFHDIQPNSYNMKLLTSVVYGNNSIELVYQNPEASTAYNYVKTIKVKKNGYLTKEIDLDMSILERIVSANDALAKLKTITIKGTDPSETSQVYRCEYDTWYLSGFSGTDHWGYSNNGNIYDVAKLNLFVGFDVDYHFPNNYAPSNYHRFVKIGKSADEAYCPFDKITLFVSNPHNPNPADDNRKPSSSHGILSKLTYPTGGYTNFEFENHKFLTATAENGDYIHDPYKKRVAEAGGFRIKKITTYASADAVPEIKNYQYGKMYCEVEGQNERWDAIWTSYPYYHTGVGEAVVDPTILTYMDYTSYMYAGSMFPIRNMILGLDMNGQREPFFNPYPFTYNPRQDAWFWECTFSASNFRRLVDGRPPVVYPEVTVYYGEIYNIYGEYTPENTTGKTVYQYDILVPTYSPNEPGFMAFFEYPQPFGNPMYYLPKKYLYNRLSKKTDYRVRGTYYDRVRVETYAWSTRTEYVSSIQYVNAYPLDMESYPSWVTIGNFFTHKTTYLGACLLGSKQTTEYDTNGNKTTSILEGYAYNNSGQVTLVSASRSDGMLTWQSFQYPEPNASGATPAIVQAMLDKNMLTPVLQQTTHVGFDFYYNSTLSGYKTEYKTFNNGSLIMPAELHELEIKPTGSEYVLRSEVLRYSPDGNPQEVLTKEGIRTIYLWGYSDRCLVAEIKNATYAQVENAVQEVFNTSIEHLATSQPDVTNLKNLRNSTHLQGAMVTTYTHRPMVGVASETDPAGRTIFYDYDGFSRLKYVKDEDGKILKENKYHYAETNN